MKSEALLLGVLLLHCIRPALRADRTLRCEKKLEDVNDGFFNLG